jgi:VIT1/CCC1 family predicted Fe2+/Mn2+ transporter
MWSLLLSGIGLVAIGAAVARFTDRPLIMGAFRQLALGAVAVAVTFGVGHAIGAGVSG